MIPDNIVLLERINTAISKKWQGRSTIVPFRVEHLSTNENAHLNDKDFFAQALNPVFIERLQKRIEGLERQNNQLFHLIDFLVENLPDLVINILCTAREKNSLLDYGDPGEKRDQESVGKSYCCERVEPHPTRREKEVLELLEKGLCAKEIANRLFISETTVITHKKNLKEKFNARNCAELISKAQAHHSKQNK